MNLTNEWAQNGTLYAARGRADKIPTLPPGVYEYQPTISGWCLNLKGSEFVFPFKIYDANSGPVNRVFDYYTQMGGNVGAWYNGVRGGGKTVVAQLLANRLIHERQMPVLLVQHPIPLAGVLEQIRQDVAIIFDEFEKTHSEDEQQALLSAVDGLSRSSYGRVFLFTTNNPKIDINFIDRPSRIRYIFQFNRVSDAVVNGLLDDMLPEELRHFADDCLTFFAGREVLTIDVVRQTIREVIAFKESPYAFANFFNVAASNPPHFTISLLDPTTGDVLKILEPWFRLEDVGHQALVQGLEHAVRKFEAIGRSVDIFNAGRNQILFRLLQYRPEHNGFLAQVRLPVARTHWAAIANHLGQNHSHFWLNQRPANYELPPSYLLPPTSGKKKKKEYEQNLEKQISRFWRATDNYLLHGDANREDADEKDLLAGVFLVKFETTLEKAPPVSHVPATLAEGYDYIM